MTRDSGSIPARASSWRRPVTDPEPRLSAAPAAAMPGPQPGATAAPSSPASVAGRVHAAQADGLPQGGGPSTAMDPPAAPRAVTESETAGLIALLKCEAEARAAPTAAELQFLIVNEIRKFARARQAFLFRRSAHLKIAAISDLVAVDSSAALVMALEDQADRIAEARSKDPLLGFDLSPYAAAAGSGLSTYPFRQALWLPLTARPGRSQGGLLLTREQPWTEADIAIAKRLAATFAHALAFHDAESHPLARLGRALPSNKTTVAIGLVAALAVLLFPVSMTTLAPFEVVPKDPFVVAAPIEGVVEQALVEPNSEIKAGEPLVRFVGTQLRNRLEVAEREVQVAEAHMKQSTQLGFDQAEGRNAVALAAAEHELKIAERNAARDLLARATITAPEAGVALFHDKGALAGKPVALGERIMLLADPAKIEVAIDVAAGDSLLLNPGGRVKVFLDSDPVHPREAVVDYADYQARVRPGESLAFRVTARLTGDEPLPRLGVRGTAQLYGERVPFGFYLFRRPITALRQWIGL